MQLVKNSISPLWLYFNCSYLEAEGFYFKIMIKKIQGNCTIMKRPWLSSQKAWLLLLCSSELWDYDSGPFVHLFNYLLSVYSELSTVPVSISLWFFICWKAIFMSILTRGCEGNEVNLLRWPFLGNKRWNDEVTIIKNILICLNLHLTTAWMCVQVYEQNLCIHDM